MKIGIPKEIKPGEGRISLSPNNVEDLVKIGHDVIIEKGAGNKSGFPDEYYIKAGAKIIDSKKKIYSNSEIVVKVKEPYEEELNYFQPGPLLFSFLHLSANEKLTKTFVEGKSTAIAFESVRLGDKLPILIPMSEVAGRMSAIIGANLLSIEYGGSGQLLGGATGIHHGYVVIIGGGTAGKSAALAANGLGAHVIVLEKDINRIRYLNDVFPDRISVIKSNSNNLRECVELANLLIGTVLIPNCRAPRIVSREMVRSMKPGSVVIDISIDQGGCIETSRPTTHDNPIYTEEDVLHYCVTNMPGAYPRSSTEALSENIFPYLVDLVSEEDIVATLNKHDSLKTGVNIFNGNITIKPIAEEFNLPYKPLEEII
ncbi:MAG: alanine dehydrogenase [Candidatus Lokiarchaeota archaeon]|nr:alanine dehydrogenase [Candidatus Lokiarchaeota archaeon]